VAQTSTEIGEVDAGKQCNAQRPETCGVKMFTIIDAETGVPSRCLRQLQELMRGTYDNTLCAVGFQQVLQPLLSQDIGSFHTVGFKFHDSGLQGHVAGISHTKLSISRNPRIDKILADCVAKVFLHDTQLQSN